MGKTKMVSSGAAKDVLLVEKMVEGVKSKGDVSAGELLPFERGQTVNEYCGPHAKEAGDDPAVIRAVDAFWDACRDNDEATVGEAAYIYLHVRVQKAMLADFDKCEAMEMAHEEFDEELTKGVHLTLRSRDSMAVDRQQLHASRRLDYTSFFASVFEIVDSWTEERDPYVYARFLTLLLERITNPETGRLFESLDDIHYRPIIINHDPAPMGEARGVCLRWDPEYIGGVMTNKKAQAAKLRNYDFTSNGLTAVKSEDRNPGTISVIKSLESIEVGCISEIQLQIVSTEGKYASVGDLDIGISTVTNMERGSRPGDDGCTSEFFITSGMRPLGEDSRARCHRRQLTNGDVVTLVVDLRMNGADGGGKGGGAFEIQVNGKCVEDENGVRKRWKVPVDAHGNYHVIAAMRSPGVSLSFVKVPRR